MAFKTSLVFTLPNPRPLEKLIARKLDKNFVKHTEWRQLSNGEWALRILQPSKRALVLGRTEAPGDNLLQTLTLVDTLHRNGVCDITLVIPYFGYSRHDRVVRQGDHLPANLFTKLFSSCGAARIITVDLHNQLTAKNSPIPLISIDFVAALADTFKKIDRSAHQFTIVSPDRGSKKRAEKFRDILDSSMRVCWLEKHRDPKTGTVHSGKLRGPKRGTTALIIDDICDTGHTIKECVRELKKNGFKTFYLCITHPVFSAHAVPLLRSLKFTRILVSNTISLSSNIQKKLPLTIVNTSAILLNTLK